MYGAAGDKRGFTLVEVMVALAVLCMVIIPAAGLFSFCRGIGNATSRDLVALTAARDIMERIKAEDITTHNLDNEIKEYKERHGVEVRVEVYNGGYGNSLAKIKVYVAPRLGMDAREEGLLLGSYCNGLEDLFIDTSLQGH